MAGGPNDPYAFSTLSYPSDATNSKENGHFMLFYVNVQNKTKYSYDGLDSVKLFLLVMYYKKKERFQKDLQVNSQEQLSTHFQAPVLIQDLEKLDLLVM